MTLPVNPAKVLRLFAPLWALMALSLGIYWQSWQSQPIAFAAVASLPIGAALLASLVRDRWRLELTPEALIHHTLGRSESFAWARMGPLELKGAPLLDRVLVRTFWFAFPLEAPLALKERVASVVGRRILCAFGDHTALETIKQIETWRALYAQKSATRQASQST